MASPTERNAALQGIRQISPRSYSWTVLTRVYQIITIGDCSKGETRKYYRERVLPRVPERIRGHLNFETLYDAFGGKLAHWHDFITDYSESGALVPPHLFSDAFQ